jgi:hypothetical protein
VEVHKKDDPDTLFYVSGFSSSHVISEFHKGINDDPTIEEGLNYVDTSKIPRKPFTARDWDELLDD